MYTSNTSFQVQNDKRRWPTTLSNGDEDEEEINVEAMVADRIVVRTTATAPAKAVHVRDATSLSGWGEEEEIIVDPIANHREEDEEITVDPITSDREEEVEIVVNPVANHREEDEEIVVDPIKTSSITQKCQEAVLAVYEEEEDIIVHSITDHVEDEEIIVYPMDHDAQETATKELSSSATKAAGNSTTNSRKGANRCTISFNNDTSRLGGSSIPSNWPVGNPTYTWPMNKFRATSNSPTSHRGLVPGKVSVDTTNGSSSGDMARPDQKMVRSKSYSPHKRNCSSIGGTVTSVKVPRGMCDSISKKGLRGNSPVRRSISPSPAPLCTLSPGKTDRGKRNEGAKRRGLQAESPVRIAMNGMGRLSPIDKKIDQTDSPDITSPSAGGTVSPVKTRRGVSDSLTNKVLRGRSPPRSKKVRGVSDSITTNSPRGRIPAGRLRIRPGSFSPVTMTESMCDSISQKGLRGNSPVRRSRSLSPYRGKVKKRGGVRDNITTRRPHRRSPVGTLRNDPGSFSPVHKITDQSESPDINTQANRDFGVNLGPIPHQDKSLFPEKSREEDPSNITDIDESPSSNNPLTGDIESMNMPAPLNNNLLPQQCDGTYTESPSTNLSLQQLSFSTIGVEPESIDHSTMIKQKHDYDSDYDIDMDNDEVDIDVYNDEEDIDVHNCYEHDIGVHDDSDPPLSERGPTAAEVLTTTIPLGTNSNDLVVARAIENDPVVRVRGRHVPSFVLQRQEIYDRKRKECRLCGYVIISICSTILGLSLGLSLGRKESSPSTSQLNVAPTQSTTRPMPPLENLELLYDELPEQTKESLYERNSSQYQAWEWVLNHPNISTYPEWRKKQVFAMATFYYSFEGHSWPEQTRMRWMDTHTSECSWVMNDFQVEYATKLSIANVGPGYGTSDWQPCNENGHLQALGVAHLRLPETIKPSIPPEIGLLTPLRILSIHLCQINTKLSELLAPELVDLPNLTLINFHGSGLTGTIPTKLGYLTGLRHLLLGQNKLTGPIPSEIARMTSLEQIAVGLMEGVNGKLPSELGLMTRLTNLGIYTSSVTGPIPTELGCLSELRTIYLEGNQLTGTIPSQLGLLSANTWLALYENRLTGSLPTQLGLMTNTVRLRIWNNDFSGFIPSEIGLMANATDFRLGNELNLDGPHNNFSGSLPEEVWNLSHLQWVFLPNLPNLSGRIPEEIMMQNLTMLSLSGSPQLSGTIPDQVCIFVDELDFDCSDLLCGCDCQCSGSGNVPSLHA